MQSRMEYIAMTKIVQVLITKVDVTLDVDVDRFSDEVFGHAMRKGLNNILNDANANAIKKDGAKDDEILALSQKALQSLYDGTFRARESTGPKGDPIRKRAIDIFLTRVVKPRWEKAGKKADPKAQLAEAVAGVKANAAYIEIAAKQLEREAAEVAELEAMEASAVESAVEELVPTA